MYTWYVHTYHEKEKQCQIHTVGAQKSSLKQCYKLCYSTKTIQACHLQASNKTTYLEAQGPPGAFT